LGEKNQLRETPVAPGCTLTETELDLGLARRRDSKRQLCMRCAPHRRNEDKPSLAASAWPPRP